MNVGTYAEVPTFRAFSLMVNIVSFLVTKHKASRLNSFGEAPFWRERGVEYLRKLFAGVARNTTQPHKLWVLTDSPELIPAGITPILSTLNSKQSPGWWAKLGIFRYGLFPEGEKVFYTDLDNVIGGPLDPILNLDPKPLIMMHDTPNQFAGRWGQGSTMLFRANELSFLWDEYQQRRREIHNTYQTWPRASDQAYIQERIEALRGAPIQLFQEELPHVKFMNSRWQLELNVDHTNCSFVYGCYIPKPHQSNHPFYKDHWRDDDFDKLIGGV